MSTSLNKSGFDGRDITISNSLSQKQMRNNKSNDETRRASDTRREETGQFSHPVRSHVSFDIAHKASFFLCDLKSSSVVFKKSRSKKERQRTTNTAMTLSIIALLRVMALTATISHAAAMTNINSTVIARNIRMTLGSAATEGENRDERASSSQQEQESSSVTIFAENAQCRCEAAWEDLYSSPSSAQSAGRRQRYYFNYETIQIRKNKLVSIENVYVLKPNAMECSNTNSNPSRLQQRPTTTTATGDQQRSPYNFNNRQLEMIDDADFNDMDYQEQQEHVEAATIMLDEQQAYYHENEQRDLQPRYHVGGGGATTASAPRTYGGSVRNYSVRPYGATTYGSYGKGIVFVSRPGYK
jgi:hypothetical protein